jgi:hypothetical protein
MVNVNASCLRIFTSPILALGRLAMCVYGNFLCCRIFQCTGLHWNVAGIIPAFFYWLNRHCQASYAQRTPSPNVLECLGMPWLRSGSLPGRRRFRDTHPECIKDERYEALFFSWSPPSLTLIRCWSLVLPSHHSVFYNLYDLNSRDGSQILLICCPRRYVRFGCVSVFLLVRSSRSYSRFWLAPNQRLNCLMLSLEKSRSAIFGRTSRLEM